MISSRAPCATPITCSAAQVLSPSTFVNFSGPTFGAGPDRRQRPDRGLQLIATGEEDTWQSS